MDLDALRRDQIRPRKQPDSINRIVIVEMDEKEVRRAVCSVEFRYGAGSPPSSSEALSGLDGDFSSVCAYEVVFFPIVFEFPV